MANEMPNALDALKGMYQRNRGRGRHILEIGRREAASLRERREFSPIISRVRPYSLVITPALYEQARLTKEIISRNIPGDFVECGVWRGGSAFLMAELLQRAGIQGRAVWLFDSFEGMPEPTVPDGEAAKEYVERVDSPSYFDNFRASLEEVTENAARLGLSSYTRLVKGWFENTLPEFRERIGKIALLRIDCDWYESVNCRLENLYDQVVDGGFIVFDDYYAFDGCAVAVHEFLGRRHIPYRLETLAPDFVMINKGKLAPPRD
jgi:O-methyltransferase